MLAVSFPLFSVSEQRYSLPGAEEWAPLFGLTIFNPQKQSAGDSGPLGKFSELIYEVCAKLRTLHSVFH